MAVGVVRVWIAFFAVHVCGFSLLFEGGVGEGKGGTQGVKTCPLSCDVTHTRPRF